VIAAELVVLDIGATLVEGPPKAPASRIAAHLGLDAAQKAVLRGALMTTPFGGPGDVAALVRHVSGLPRVVVDPVVSEVWDAQLREARPLPGALEALAELRAGGLRLALISNIWPPYLAAVREHFGAFFDEHIPEALQRFSFREGCAKPGPQLFERALRAAGVAARDAVMVGDSYAEDIEPAARLGISTVLVLHRPQRETAGLVRVLNGEAPRPSRTIQAIAQLGAGVVAPRRPPPREARIAHPVR
jgi:HAD superfamily hydrolase (TIGR01509 family)